MTVPEVRALAALTVGVVVGVLAGMGLAWREPEPGSPVSSVESAMRACREAARQAEEFYRTARTRPR